MVNYLVDLLLSSHYFGNSFYQQQQHTAVSSEWDSWSLSGKSGQRLQLFGVPIRLQNWKFRCFDWLVIFLPPFPRFHSSQASRNFRPPQLSQKKTNWGAVWILLLNRIWIMPTARVKNSSKRTISNRGLIIFWHIQLTWLRKTLCDGDATMFCWKFCF